MLLQTTCKVSAFTFLTSHSQGKAGSVGRMYSPRHLSRWAQHVVAGWSTFCFYAGSPQLQDTSLTLESEADVMRQLWAVFPRVWATADHRLQCCLGSGQSSQEKNSCLSPGRGRWIHILAFSAGKGAQIVNRSEERVYLPWTRTMSEDSSAPFLPFSCSDAAASS